MIRCDPAHRACKSKRPARRHPPIGPVRQDLAHQNKATAPSTDAFSNQSEPYLVIRASMGHSDTAPAYRSCIRLRTPRCQNWFFKKKNFKSFQDWMRTLITLVTSLLELHRQIVGRRCEIFASSNCASETWISTHEWHDHKTRSYNFSALRHIVRGGYAWTNTPSWESFNAGN